MTRPTAVQERALRDAIGNGREGPAYAYADRTLRVMARNRWIELDHSREVYRVLSDGARVLGLFGLSDEYAREDALASDPVAQRTDATIRRAAALGVSNVEPLPYSNARVEIDAATLATLLDAYEIVDRRAVGVASS
jgi:hypothetical protein